MDFSYSPGREPGGTLHLSPTHLHNADSLTTMRALRRSMSRSPSRANWISTKSSSAPPASPHSPSPKKFSSPLKKTMNASSPYSTNDGIIAGEQHPSSARKLRPTLRRGLPVHSQSTTPQQQSVRRALSDSSDQGNAGRESVSPKSPSYGQENSSSPSDSPSESHRFGEKGSFLQVPNFASASPSHDRFGNETYQSRFGRPVKSSPLKRSDGVMNLDRAYLGSPSAKRRSLHGAFSSPWFTADSRTYQDEGKRSDDETASSDTPFRSTLAPRFPTMVRSSPNRRTIDRRTARARKSVEFAPQSPGVSRSNSRSGPRTSLDSAVPSQEFDMQEFSRPPPSHRLQMDRQQSRLTRQQPHPLSNALSPTSPTPPATDSASQTQSSFFEIHESPQLDFSKSLPIGAMRPIPQGSMLNQPIQAEESVESCFATPAMYKIARPDPAAFRSTGLISKRHRDPDDMPPPPNAQPGMPDTPCKKVPGGFNFPSSPTPSNSAVKSRFAQPEFGTPSKPFNVHAGRSFLESFGASTNVFGTDFGRDSVRRASFTSIDGDDDTQSPPGKANSQSSADELPPTPTKQVLIPCAKPTSLRSSILGRKPALSMSTFVPPEAPQQFPPQDEAYFTQQSMATIGNRLSPRTPAENADNAFPDPSNLSISPRFKHPTPPDFDSTIASRYPPETPTSHRENEQVFTGFPPVTTPSHNQSNHAMDVDPVLTSRFTRVEWYGRGEFSDVYRVHLPSLQSSNQSYFSPSIGSKYSQTPKPDRVWIVKKARTAYTSYKNRENKLREAKVMKALGKSDHVVNLIDSWEANSHLYIQTEFCEEGSLHTFLAKMGTRGRLDDFRIWKILIDLCLGVKHIHDSGFIHLDLKPANVFIDFGGNLKIGDFGLACEWPAPSHVEGEGDRRYIGPDLLQGFFDKPADIFALGMMMFEIAANAIPPDNGVSWQKLRSGDWSGLPSLTSGSSSSLFNAPASAASDNLIVTRAATADSLADAEPYFRFNSGWHSSGGAAVDLPRPPRFMLDPDDADALDALVYWMMSPQPEERPAVDQILASRGVLWVSERRRSGAVVYEGAWGPPNHVLASEGCGQMVRDVEDEEMLDVL